MGQKLCRMMVAIGTWQDAAGNAEIELAAF
jgi:hypothetical protein